MKKIIAIFLTLISVVTFNTCFAIDSSDPVNMLKGISDQMIADLQAHKATLKSNPSQVYGFARTVIVPHADLAEMSKRVLPPRIWNEASASQRSQFQQQFTNLLIRTYASALAEYKDESVQFFPVRGGASGKTTVRVDSNIVRSEGPSIAVNYRLVYKNGQWRLYDMVVDGVSLLESFRSQFADKLSKGSMDDLLRDMSAHNSNS